nr:zf-TFIIB domain-containing protein [Pseudoroseomonas coralli]
MNLGEARAAIQPRNQVVTLSPVDIYRSQNGDSWQLIRDPIAGRISVRHQANPASGGHVTDVEVEEFLSRDGSGPEYDAARALLASLKGRAGELAQIDSRSASVQEGAESEAHPFSCPCCGAALAKSERQGIKMDYCPKCRGAWLDRGELDKILGRAEASPQASQPAPAPPAGGWI